MCCPRHPTVHQHIQPFVTQPDASTNQAPCERTTITGQPHHHPDGATMTRGCVSTRQIQNLRQSHTRRHQPHNTTHNCGRKIKLLRKEVIQPHLPVRLPCYDFVPIADPTFDSSHNRPLASGVTNFHDVTGGVYKARERIHRSVADLRLLATPTSWGRVADPNPNYDRLYSD